METESYNSLGGTIFLLAYLDTDTVKKLLSALKNVTQKSLLLDIDRARH